MERTYHMLLRRQDKNVHSKYIGRGSLVVTHLMFSFDSCKAPGVSGLLGCGGYLPTHRQRDVVPQTPWTDEHFRRDLARRNATDRTESPTGEKGKVLDESQTNSLHLVRFVLPCSFLRLPFG